MPRSATNEGAGSPIFEFEESEASQPKDASREFLDSEEEGADDVEESEIKHAARAGIRLLEENAHLQEELYQLQEQCAQIGSEKEELLRLVTFKEQRELQLSEHLRQCIRENQDVLSELRKAKELTNQLEEQLQAQTICRSPSEKRLSPRLDLHSQLGSSVTTPLADAEEGRTYGQSVPTLTGRGSQEYEHVPIARRNSMSTVQEAETELQLKSVELHRRINILEKELARAHKQIDELKQFQLQLRESEIRVQLLQTDVEDQAREIAFSAKEREEERELIQSLRHTIEIYQTLENPCVQKFDELRAETSRGEEGLSKPPRSSNHRLTNRSRKLIYPKPHSSSMNNMCPVLEERLSLRDENDRLLAELEHLGEQVLNLKLLEGISRTVRSSRDFLSDPSYAIPVLLESRSWTESTVDSVGPVGYGTSSRMRLLEQQAAVLHDLLRQFKSQWKYERAIRRAVECEKTDLLQRLERLQAALRRQCRFCGKEREDIKAEGTDFSWENSAAVYETLVDHTAECQPKEEQAEAERVCFSILRRLVDSWTTDKAKRMRLHDWLTNAIRGTGKRRPLYLHGLSGEIASGFQVLLVPILREKFGVHVQIEKRLRSVIVTDLKMQIAGADVAKAKSCLQRISRSLLWLIDVESALTEDQEWIGDYARKKAAKMCVNI